MRRAQAGHVELILLSVLWGSIGAIVKDVRVGAAGIAAIRMTLGCLVVVAAHAGLRRLRDLRLHARRGLVVADGVMLAVHWALMFEAFKRLSVSTAILLVFVGPVFVAALVGPVLGERVERRTLASIALSFGGMIVIAVPAWQVQDPLGVVFALGSALAFAAIMLIGKQLTRLYRPQTILVWQLGVGAVAVSPFAAVAGYDGIGRALPALVTLGVVHTAFAGFVYFRALTVVKAQHVGVLTYLEPVTAAIYAWLLLGETPPLATYIGGALIVAGGLNVVLAEPRAGASPQEPLAPDPRRSASLGP